MGQYQDYLDATPTGSDIALILDVSDTADGVNGTTKKVTLDSLPVSTPQLTALNLKLSITNFLTSLIASLSSFTTPEIVAGVLTLDCSGINNFVTAHNQNITSLLLTNVPSGVMCSFTLTLTQNATGGRTIAIPASFKIMNDAMVLNTLANKTSIITASTIDSGATWACHWSTEI